MTQLRSLINLYANAQLLTIFYKYSKSIKTIFTCTIFRRFNQRLTINIFFSYGFVSLYYPAVISNGQKKKDILTKEQGRVITQVSVVTCLLWVLFSCPRRLWNKHFVAFSYTVYCSLQNLSMFNT